MRFAKEIYGRCWMAIPGEKLRFSFSDVNKTENGIDQCCQIGNCSSGKSINLELEIRKRKYDFDGVNFFHLF